VVDTSSSPGSEVQHLPVYNPEPAAVTDGRQFLYDATLTSSNGEAACASCHIFGDFDSLAWDLGDPRGTVLNNPNPFRLTIGENTELPPGEGPDEDAAPGGEGKRCPHARARRPPRRQRPAPEQHPAPRPRRRLREVQRRLRRTPRATGPLQRHDEPVLSRRCG